MGDSPDFQTPDERKQRAWVDKSDWVDTSEPKLSKEEQQELAHGRNRICKERGCAVCAPLREQRRLKKAQRKAETQALLQPTVRPDQLCARSLRRSPRRRPGHHASNAAHRRPTHRRTAGRSRAGPAAPGQATPSRPPVWVRGLPATGLHRRFHHRMHPPAPGPATVPIRIVRHRYLRGRPLDEIISSSLSVPSLSGPSDRSKRCESPAYGHRPCASRTPVKISRENPQVRLKRADERSNASLPLSRSPSAPERSCSARSPRSR